MQKYVTIPLTFLIGSTFTNIPKLNNSRPTLKGPSSHYLLMLMYSSKHVWLSFFYKKEVHTMAVSGVHTNIEPRLSLYRGGKNTKIFPNIFFYVRIKKCCTSLEQHKDEYMGFNEIKDFERPFSLFKMPWFSYFCLIKINLFTSMFHW